MFDFLVGFRKFTVTILAVALLTGFLISGHIDGKVFGSSLTSICVGFFGTNMGEHLLNLGKDWIKSKLKKENKDG